MQCRCESPKPDSSNKCRKCGRPVQQDDSDDNGSGDVIDTVADVAGAVVRGLANAASTVGEVAGNVVEGIGDIDLDI